MCSTYSTNSSRQTLDQSKVYNTMDSKRDQQNKFVVAYNPCKQFTNVYKTCDKDPSKAMAGNLNSEYPNNDKRSDGMKYFHEDIIEDVTSHLHDVVQQLQNLNGPKSVYTLDVNDSHEPQIPNTDMDQERQDKKMLNSEGACGVDVVDFPSALSQCSNTNELASNSENSHFLKEFFKKPKTRSPKKSPKHRNHWHKTNEQYSKYDADIEIAEEAYTTVPSDFHFAHSTCTLNNFITIQEEAASLPTNFEYEKFDPICYSISPPKRIPRSRMYTKPVQKFSTTQLYCDNDIVFIQQEECYSVSPPSRGSFFRKRVPSVTSEDSFIVFGDGGDSDCTESDSDDDTSSEEEDCSSSDDESTLSSANSGPDMLTVNSGQRKVRFADEKNLEEVHVIIAWDFAYRACRKGHWEECVRDRERFRLRIMRTGNCLKNIFDPEYRDRIYKERFSNDVTRFD